MSAVWSLKARWVEIKAWFQETLVLSIMSLQRVDEPQAY